MSVIETVESAIVTQLKTLDAFDPNTGAVVRGVSDIATFINLTTLEPPSAIVVFDGEKAKPDMTIGKVTQETQMFWTIYLVASSFGTDGEGRLGIYEMIDEVSASDGLEGFVIDFPGVIKTKLTYIGSARFQVADTVVIYEARFRHQFLRQGA